ncbi:MAG: hypothetical protein QOJ29_1545 [Thermoleophilaceae bacterium]|nr:hypothetical protein [Thermoleophilaceae bacterium]
MAHNHCQDFSRAGMPQAAGAGLSRRSFLMRGSALALSVYGGTRLLGIDALQAGVAQAAAGDAPPVIVSVFLEGGIDALSVLAPVGDSAYQRLRPKLALPEEGLTRFGADERLAWHPSAAPLATLFDEGKLAVMPAVGYDHPDQSHFTSRHFWEVGATDAGGRTGWLGRYLDRAGTPDNPLQGLSLDGSLAPALAAARVPVAAVAGPDDYGFWARNVWGTVEDRMLQAIGELGAAHGGSSDPALAQAAGAAAQSATLRTQLAPFGEKNAIVTAVPYPDSRDDFPTQLKALAALLAAGLPIRCVAISAAGEYDTHDDQAEDLADGLKLTADSLLAFQRDLEARGLADRVVIHVWSEFGRRAQENGSHGTDHGAAGVGFVIGSRVNGGLIGEYPGLDQLDKDGNLRATSDFRGLYCALLEQWLGTDAGAVIPGASAFTRPALIR